ncbi:MAG: DUF6627 family protein [Thiobacillus sp.]
MPIRLSLRKCLALLLSCALLGAPVLTAHAAMIGTAQALAAEQGRIDRERLASLLEREDLQRQLATLGVDVQDARQRVASLTDAEVSRLNQRLAELPAGGDVLGAILLIFIVFVITDAIGATDIFPFVHPVR